MRSLIIIFYILIICSCQKYQKSVYQFYFPSSTIDAHNIKIIWSNDSPNSEILGESGWIYQFIRSESNQEGVGTANEIPNNYTNYEKYFKYLPAYNGENMRSYVAYDITPTCVDGHTEVTAKLKFFDVDTAALGYYLYLNSLTDYKNTIKIVWGKKKNGIIDQNEITYLDVNYPSSMFLGFNKQDILFSCS